MLRRIGRILSQLGHATGKDPQNARWWVDQANWYGEYFEANHSIDNFEAGLVSAGMARRLDPRGESGYLAQVRLLFLAARHLPRSVDRLKYFNRAVNSLTKIVATHPQDARLHAFLAEVLARTGNSPLAQKHALRGADLGCSGSSSFRRLTERQRKQLRQQFPTLPQT